MAGILITAARKKNGRATMTTFEAISMVHTSGQTISSTSDDRARQSKIQICVRGVRKLDDQVAHPDRAPDTTIVECGRCNSPRGTLAALRDLARQGRSDPVRNGGGPGPRSRE